jgi:hypothetical protein
LAEGIGSPGREMEDLLRRWSLEEKVGVGAGVGDTRIGIGVKVQRRGGIGGRGRNGENLMDFGLICD